MFGCNKVKTSKDMNWSLCSVKKKKKKRKLPVHYLITVTTQQKLFE